MGSVKHIGCTGSDAISECRPRRLSSCAARNKRTHDRIRLAHTLAKASLCRKSICGEQAAKQAEVYFVLNSPRRAGKAHWAVGRPQRLPQRSRRALLHTRSIETRYFIMRLLFLSTKVGSRTMIRESELSKVIEDGGKSPATSRNRLRQAVTAEVDKCHRLG